MGLFHGGGIPLPTRFQAPATMLGMAPDLDPSTVVVHAGRPERVPNAPVGDSPVFSSTYVAGGDRGYGRFGNDAWTAFEETLGALEGGRGLAFASGMAAAAAVCDLVPVGGRVVAPIHAYSGVLALLDQQAATGRLTVDRVDVADTEAVAAAAVGADMVWVESPTNPAMEVADLPAIAAAGAGGRWTVVVDNTFATPLLQQPLRMGADIVMHSATKFIAGHSDVVLGAVITAHDELWSAIELRRRSLGAIPGPMETWLGLRGLRTLALRLERSQSTAAFLAQRLLEHPQVSRVRYPGCPTMPVTPARRRRCPGSARSSRSRSAATPSTRSGSARAPSCGSTQPVWAAWSRCSNGVAGGRSRCRPSPTT